MAEIKLFTAGTLTPERLNQLVAVANRIAKFSVAGAVDGFSNADDGLGLVVSECQGKLAIKLTGGGTSGLYDWTKQRPIDVSPWWEDDTPNAEAGTVAADPAIEMNENSTLTIGTIVHAWREADGSLRFRLEVCA